ncbi:hypothetical protein [Thiohalorhabdus denitrificans]|uniref:hypothetical protein n=1 Tax=Thiohalorhabdus denitrificans TaxID=381306 RepID=UPI0012E13A70|nr:hypothetical protein [Thiohalorhabdus denitrificans]
MAVTMLPLALLAGCAANGGPEGASAEEGLRYKGQGPPCMCNSGLSEAEVQEAERSGEE